MKNIREKFSVIDDQRHQSYVEHKLTDILIIIMCMVICGIDELCEIVKYAENKREFLQKEFGIDKIPSKPTFSRVLNMIDGIKVANIIIEIMQENVENMGEIIAVDGKAIRSTTKKGKAHSALQILTAYFTESGVVLGQESIHEKTNEIPIFQTMLDYIDISGKIITADAMHCQKETCKKIIENKGNYVFGLKENQKNLYEEIELFINDKTNAEYMEIFTTTNKSHGRIEKIICHKIVDIDWISMKKEWAGLSSVFAVKRVTITKYGTSESINFYISSLDVSAEKLLYISREHWKIESMHWLLDVVFSEDESKILSENGLKTLNIFRKLSLLMHKKYIASQKKKQSIKGNMFDCLLNDDKLIQIILCL